MRYLQFTLFIIFSVLLATNVSADNKKNDKPMNHEEMMEIYNKLAAPGEPHKLFASLAGNWITKTKEWVNSQEPAIESTGSADLKLLLGGRFLQQEITGSMHGKPYSGIWTIAYDNLLKQYVSTWIDTMSTQIFMMSGTASEDGRVIIFTGQHAEVGGGYMSHRANWKIIDNNTQEFIMYGVFHGGEEMKMLEVIYTRK